MKKRIARITVKLHRPTDIYRVDYGLFGERLYRDLSALGYTIWCSKATDTRGHTLDVYA